jgi:hypothetical protein
MAPSFPRQLFAYIAAVMLLFAIFLMLATLAVPAHAQQATSDLVSGSGSATGTGATTVIAAPTTTRRIYVSSVECFRTDAGTTATYVTLNDDGAHRLAQFWRWRRLEHGVSESADGSGRDGAQVHGVERRVDGLLQRARLHGELMTPLAAFVDEVRSSPKFVASLARKPSLEIDIANTARFLARLDAGYDGAHAVRLRARLEQIVNGDGTLKDRLAAIDQAISTAIAPFLKQQARVN